MFVTESFAKVDEMVMSADPLKLVAVPVTSPDIAIVLAVCRVVAVEAFPVTPALAVMAPDAEIVVNVPAAAVVPPITALLMVPPEIVGLVMVLFVSVSVVARPTRVSVEVGSVRVPVLEIEEITGLVNVLLVRVSVELIVGTLTPSTVSLPAAPLAKVVSEAWPSSIEPTPIAEDAEAVIPLTGRPVQFVRVPEAGVPRMGVVRVGLVRVLLVSVSVVARPTSVSVEVGRVKIPVLEIWLMTGVVRVLLVRVSVVALPISVSVEVGRVKVPVLEMLEMTGLVSVLLVRVSVVALPTRVSVEVGSVRVPVLEIDEITGFVNVLLVSVSTELIVGTFTPST